MLLLFHQILQENSSIKSSHKFLLEANAPDPVATSSAISAVSLLMQSVFNSMSQCSLQYLQNSPQNRSNGLILSNLTAANLATYANYNPENITSYNIVTGLLGVVLTMTMVIITSMGITRELGKGTMEGSFSHSGKTFRGDVR